MQFNIEPLRSLLAPLNIFFRLFNWGGLCGEKRNLLPRRDAEQRKDVFSSKFYGFVKNQNLQDSPIQYSHSKLK